MDKIILHMIFENSEGSKVRVKINDVRDNITAQEVSVLANNIIDNNIMSFKNKTLAHYVGSELEKISIEAL